ncbi:MAG TPA: Ig-like domain-containing protein [Candidatus Binatia bacterium]|nr:Ig-like domain-containing protein [Candidatus Binatia bacterium]
MPDSKVGGVLRVCSFDDGEVSRLRRGGYSTCTLEIRIVAAGILLSLLVMCGCGSGAGSASGGVGDTAPTFHGIGIASSPLPTSPLTLALSPAPGMLFADCYPGSSVQLYGLDTVFPQNNGTPQSSNASSMQWSSSDSSVAMVSTSGLVSCISQGTTQIEATVSGEICSGDGRPCKALASITVGTAKRTLILSPNSVTLNSGQSQQMTATLVTETAPGVSTQQDVTNTCFSNGNFSWSSIGNSNNMPPLDMSVITSGNLVAQGSGSGLIWVAYPTEVQGVDYYSNLVVFTSK